MTKTRVFFICLIVLIFSLGVSISLQSILAAWTNPTANPPIFNTLAPINTGANGQAKLAGLILNAIGINANGLIVATGSVGIGTTAPSKALDVAGDIQASGDICTSMSGGKCLSSIRSSGENIYSEFAATKGMYTAWGDDTCAAGYHKLYQGWMYISGQYGGYGGDWVCSKTRQGTNYLYQFSSGEWKWKPAPPCAVCAKNETTIGQCYTNWGDNACAAGFDRMYNGKSLAAGGANGYWKDSLVCATKGSQSYRYYKNTGYVWEGNMDCSVCCSQAGGTFTSYGDYNTAGAPSCPAGYSALYSGNMFQSGQRSGFGSNAVCGTDTASRNRVYIYNSSIGAQWVNIPCSVCSKSETVGQCVTVWGSDSKTLPGYDQIYRGGMYSGGAQSGDGGGLACTSGQGNYVYVYDPSIGYKWDTYPCALYCDSKDGAQYTSWGTNVCAAGYETVYKGNMYQGGTYSGYGSKFECDSGYPIRIYTYSPSTGYVWSVPPSCSKCVKKSAAGQCYTHYGNDNCSSGYAPVYKGYMYFSGTGQNYGEDIACTPDKFTHRTINIITDDVPSHTWEEQRPCAQCCQMEE